MIEVRGLVCVTYPQTTIWGDGRYGYGWSSLEENGLRPFTDHSVAYACFREQVCILEQDGLKSVYMGRLVIKAAESPADTHNLVHLRSFVLLEAPDRHGFRRILCSDGANPTPKARALREGSFSPFPAMRLAEDAAKGLGRKVAVAYIHIASEGAYRRRK